MRIPTVVGTLTSFPKAQQKKSKGNLKFWLRLSPYIYDSSSFEGGRAVDIGAENSKLALILLIQHDDKKRRGGF
jgi:hypothetical protein